MTATVEESTILKSLQATVGKSFDKVRKEKDPFAAISVPDGTYHGKLASVKAGVKSGTTIPMFTFTFVVEEPAQHKGQQIRWFYMIQKSKSGKQTADQAMGRVITDYQALGIDTGQKGSDYSLANVIETTKSLTIWKPDVKVLVSTSGTNGEYRNVSLTGLWIDDTEPLGTDDGASGEDGYGIGAAPPPADSNEPQASADASDTSILIGDDFDYKPPRSRKVVPVTVTAVDEDAETVSIKRDDSDKVYDGVPFDKLIDLPPE